MDGLAVRYLEILSEVLYILEFLHQIHCINNGDNIPNSHKTCDTF